MRKPVVVRLLGVRARVRFVGTVCSLMRGSLPGYSDRLLKRDFGLARCLDQGEDGMGRWVGWGIVTANLAKIAETRVARQRKTAA